MLLFVSAVILIYNFFPVTAIQIVMLALLNDGAILSIAYDNVRYREQPEAWNMRLVLVIATVLGIVGPVAAFGMFYLGDKVFHLDHAHLQTLMYLTLSVAGHLTIFLARTRGPFWSTRPARILLVAVLGTQALATPVSYTHLDVYKRQPSGRRPRPGYAMTMPGRCTVGSAALLPPVECGGHPAVAPDLW